MGRFGIFISCHFYGFDVDCVRYGLGYLDDFPFSEKEINIGSNDFDLLEGLSLILYKEKYAMAFKDEWKTRKNVFVYSVLTSSADKPLRITNVRKKGQYINGHFNRLNNSFMRSESVRRR